MISKRAPAGLAQASDVQLAEYVRQGDDAAFAVLVERYWRPLHRHCRRLLGNDAAAEDAVQQALLSALRALRAGAEVRRLEPWLHRIARNAALSELAARGAGHQALTEDLVDRRATGVAEGRAELRAALLAVAELPSGQRHALLGAVRGDSHAEIAARLGVSEVSARQLLSRARTAIRSTVGAWMPGPLAWLSRQAHGVAQRLPVPSVTVAPFIPKLVAAAAAVGAIAAPAGLGVLHSRADSPPATATTAGPGRLRPATALLYAAGSAAARLSATRRDGGAGTPSWRVGAGRHGATGTVGTANGSGPGPAGPPGAPAATTSGAGAAPRGTADTTATSADAMPTDQSWSDAGAADQSSDPSAPDATATDPSATDPTTTATDPGASDPTTTPVDPSATDPTATATDPASQSTTDTTTTDPTVSAP